MNLTQDKMNKDISPAIVTLDVYTNSHREHQGRHIILQTSSANGVFIKAYLEYTTVFNYVQTSSKIHEYIEIHLE